MEDLPEDLRSFLEKQSCFELTESKKIKCLLNGHEFPCSLSELQLFISGKKYKKLSAKEEFNYSQYEPHITNSTKQPNHLFCKLTLRHINREPKEVLRHVSGKRYQKALAQYEECVRQGVKFVPVQLRKKQRRTESDEDTDRRVQKKKKKQTEDSGVWAPSSSEEDHSDSEDSMSDLYPPSLFSLKNADDEQQMKDDDFQTDEDDDEEEMEVESQEQKRRKVQSAGFTKKFKKNNKKNGFKRVSRVNGK
ncbi:surfeit locus protein 2 [Danio aesculapii]|uniref:surfeit locus protein 2 n=1 Tax=Danio aesculapii TaxID=1142201 RepID=UPI0024C06D9F|nr:surfeit locus protein 2 [Danio aesculapii]